MVYLNRVLRCTRTHFRAQRPIVAKWRDINDFEEMKNPPGWNPEGLRGADGSRNRDLFDANEALYQLSYSPLDVTLLRKATRNNIVRSAVKRNLTPKCRRRGKSPTPLRMDTAVAPGNVIMLPAHAALSFRCRTRIRCRPSRTARPRTRRRCGSPRRTPCRWWRRR